MKGKHVILGVTGSVAAFKAADIAAVLRSEEARVTVVMTDCARRFITPLTFESLTQQPVVTDLWERTSVPQPIHLSLVDDADLLLVAPATANFIGKLSAGLCDDILTCTALAFGSAVLIAPAMNDRMYNHPAVQRNLETLKERGCILVGPVEGRLASGRVGMGRLAPLESILKAVRSVLRTGTKDRQK